MDIVDLWESIVDKLNLTQACGKCWKFYAPLTEFRLNVVKQDNDDCCVNVFLIRDRGTAFGSTVRYDNGFMTGRTDSETYRIMFLIKSKEGLNNYNELPNNDVLESRYETIFRPLKQCIESTLITDICNHNKLVSWNGEYIYDYQDEMYYGFALNIKQENEK